jgi:hypothetical protein
MQRVALWPESATQAFAAVGGGTLCTGHAGSQGSRPLFLCGNSSAETDCRLRQAPERGKRPKTAQKGSCVS